MRRFSIPYRRRVCALVLVAFAAAGCEQAQREEPTTATPEVATTPDPRPAPSTEPDKPALPGGLASDSLNDFETAAASDPRMRELVGSGQPVRVALLAPLSGRAGTVGQMMLKAAQMAVFDQGADRLMLMPKDTESTPLGARTAAEAAVAEGAHIILGPLFGDHVPLVRDIAARNRIKVLAFSNDASKASDGTLILGLTPETEIRRIVGFAARNGYSRFGALLPDSNYGRVVAENLREAAIDAGAAAERIYFYPAGAQASDDRLLNAARSFADYDARAAALKRERARLKNRGDDISKQALRRLENLDTFGDPPFDAVLIAEPRSRLQTMAPLLAYYDIDPETVRYLGMSSWYGDGLETEPTLIGAWFPHPDPKLINAFSDRYRSEYGETPLDIAALAYGAVAMTADLVRTAQPGQNPFSADRLHNPDGFRAYLGAFRIGPDNTTDRQLSILRVTENGPAVIDEAPENFDLLIN